MIQKPNIERMFVGKITEQIAPKNASKLLIIESGILGGDMIPRGHLEATIRALKDKLEKAAEGSDDKLDVRVVGSAKYGTEANASRALFGDIDIILRCEKIETLDRIKHWAHTGKETANVRDIKSKLSGTDLKLENLGDQFSFLFPIHKEDGKPMSLTELKAILQFRHGSTTYKQNHDEKLRVQTNLDNIKDRDGLAMVQIDVMKVIVHGMEMDGLIKRAQKLKDRVLQISHTHAKPPGAKDGDDTPADMPAQVHGFMDTLTKEGGHKDFEHYYKYLKSHDELQSNDDQQLLAAMWYVQERGDYKKVTSERFNNLEYRYSFHPDALQIIYYIANQLGIVLDDHNFTPKKLNEMLRRAELAEIIKGPNQIDKDGQPVPAVKQKRMTVEMLRNPHEVEEAFKFFVGPHKEAAKRFIVMNTRNKRTDESNPSSLYKNYGSRTVKRV